MSCLKPYKSSGGPTKSKARTLCAMFCPSNSFYAPKYAIHVLSPHPLGSDWAGYGQSRVRSQRCPSTAQGHCISTVKAIMTSWMCLSARGALPVGPTSPNLPFSSERGILLAPRRSPNALFESLSQPAIHKNIVARHPRGGRKVCWVFCSQVQPPGPSRHGPGAAPLRKEKGVTNRGRTSK